MSIEELAKQIFTECANDDEPVTMEEAVEMARMELGAKGINRGSAIDKTEKKEKKPREIKVSDAKMALFSMIWEGLYNYYGENAEIVKQNKLIRLKIDGKSFKLDLIEERPTKK